MSKKHFLPLFLLALIFGGFYLWLVSPNSTDIGLTYRFDWPDETANYFWASHFSASNNLYLKEPLNGLAQNQIHPRSFNVRPDGALVPGSFLGLILIYGVLAKIFGSWSIIYYTPILSIFGALAFYGVIKRIFNDKVALVSTVLLLIHPAWIYYSVTSLLPNVPFISLLLISFYFLLKSDKMPFSHLFISATLFGLAVAIRPSEFIWEVALLLGVIVLARDKIKFSHVVLFLIISAAAVFPSVYYQKTLYGGYLTSGYAQLEPENLQACTSCQLVKSFILPFGLHPNLVASNIWTHYLSRLWWLSLITLLGLVSFLVQKKQSEKVFAYVMLSIFIFGWIGVYYGSWEFTDKLTVHLNTLGLSYVRYFLPLFILAIPFTATGLLWLTSILKRRWEKIGMFVLVFGLFYASADLALSKKPDSIFNVKDRIEQYSLNAQHVNYLTPEDSVIVTVRKDKLFFPERKVIHTFQALSLNSELSDIIKDLIKEVDVYYYALGAEPTLELDNGLKLERVDSIGEEILYKVYE